MIRLYKVTKYFGMCRPMSRLSLTQYVNYFSENNKKDDNKDDKKNNKESKQSTFWKPILRWFPKKLM